MAALKRALDWPGSLAIGPQRSINIGNHKRQSQTAIMFDRRMGAGI